ncbi:MAG: RagB/SusD family nutrient uptake outer membrane protein [Chitinophagaceae bacterium]
MKLSKIKIALVIVIAIGFASCSKKLDKYPYSSIELSQSFKTVKDAKTWDNGFYAYLRGSVYGIYTFATDVQADQLNASIDYGNRNGAPHRWNDFLADDYTIRDSWSGYYSAITNLNIAIDGYTQIVAQSTAETDSLNKFTGDAYAARAYYYHQLVLRWAKPYEPATAATDLAVPLLTKYDINAKPVRATVKAVYDQIISDIVKAKTLLANVTGRQGATHFNKDVVNALDARVKLSMQDWAGAKTAADLVINTNLYPLITTQAGLAQMWLNDVATEVVFMISLSKPNELGNSNSIYLGSYGATTKRFTPDFIPSKWVIDSYEDKDIRKFVYFAKLPIASQAGNFDDVYLVNKYPGNPALFTTANTNFQQAPKVFRVAESYLISAEAASKNGDAASALTTINKLRVARGLTALAGVTGDALLQAIKDERTRELAFEGFRLDDLKRWHLGFTRREPQNLNLITTGTQYQGLTIAADADKFVWGLPTNDVTINTNLKQNNGW